MDLHITAQGYHPYYSILEMRKEKSRDAARSRRGKENYEFYELAKLLPLPAAITTQLDKASIIRLSISYLKLRDFTAHGDPPWAREGPPPSKALKGGSIRSRSASSLAMDIFEQHQGTHILQSLDGFAFALSADGRFLYISETVSIYLGLSQVEMTGSSVFDYIHQQDHAELAEQLGINLSQSQSVASSSSPGSDDSSSTPASLERPPPVMTASGNGGMDRSFCIRMKSTLTKRGCHFKSSGYRVVLVLSRLRPAFSSLRKGGQHQVLGMVAMAIALPPPSINEVRLESDMFVTRLTFEFRVAHCEPRVSELLDYSAEELSGKNMYALCHGQDVQRLRKCHLDLIHKGQAMSGYYRLINKRGGYSWLQTCATVICNAKNSEEQSIICVNYVLSGAECENCVLDSSQMPSNLKPDDPSNSEHGSTSDADGRDDASSREGHCTPKPTQTEGRCSSSAGAEHSDHLTQLVHTESLHAAPDRCSVRSEDLEAQPSKKRRLTSNGHPKSPSESSLSGSPAPSSPDKIDRPWKRSPRYPVKELEDVMNKHLPEEKRSTIQWIGPQTTLPASSLLRQIYVNRESVIRSGAHINRPSWDSQQQPTPPGDAPFPAAAEQFNGYYSAETYSAAMTPPASVSPRDKFHIAEFSEAAAAAAAAAMPHMHHYELPLKPQVFYQPHEQYSGFHLYHGAKQPNGAWYPQTNT